MSDSIIKPIEIEVGGRALRLRYSRRSQYRLQGIPRNTDFNGLSNPKRAFATLVNWLWALALDCPFDSPEELAEAVEPGQVAGLMESLCACLKSATVTEADAKKPTG